MIIDESLSFDILHPQPLMIIVSGPSGVGKDTVLKSLRQRGYPIHFVVTATTRTPRPEEIPGEDYIFYSQEEFKFLIEHDGFIENSLVYTDYKGIPKSQIVDAIASQKDIIMRLDVQGAAKMKKLFPEAVLIFLVPRNIQEWFDRLQNRKTENEESLRVRIETVQNEMQHIQEFDYIVINAASQLEKAVDTIVAIIDAEHHRTNHRKFSL